MSLYFGMDRPERTKAVRNLAYAFAAVTAVSQYRCTLSLRAAIPVFSAPQAKRLRWPPRRCLSLQSVLSRLRFASVTTAIFMRRSTTGPHM